VILEGLIALGIGFAEELLFRGWLDELQRDFTCGPLCGTLMDMPLYMLHFIKPPAEILRTLPGFPALLLLGLTFVWRSAPTGVASAHHLHSGLVWGYYIINVAAGGIFWSSS